MALIIQRNLKKPSILNGDGLPSIDMGVEGQSYVRLTTRSLFIKMKPVLNTVIFNKTNKPYNIILSETYLSCNGPISHQQNSGVGISTLPLVETDLFVVAFKIVSVGANHPIIGFCDNNRSIDDKSYSNTVLFDLKRNILTYTSNKIIRDIYIPCTSMKNNDIVHFAVDRNQNRLWVGLNGKWCSSDPGVIIKETPTFIDRNLSITQPTVYIIPNGSVVDIVDYPFVFPAGYSQAKSIPVLDWYKNGVFEREGYL